MIRLFAIATVAAVIAVPAHADCSRYEKILMKNWAKDVIKRQMNDPKSARFSEVRVEETRSSGCKAQVIGVVRGKNAFGATVAQRFIAQTRIASKDRPAVDDVQFF